MSRSVQDHNRGSLLWAKSMNRGLTDGLIEIHNSQRYFESLRQGDYLKLIAVLVHRVDLSSDERVH